MDSNERVATRLVNKHDHVSREFGDRIKALRDRAGITLEQLSDRSGVSRAMLSKVERGEKSPTIGIAARIARGLDTSLSVLTGGQEQRRTLSFVRKNERHIFRDEETGFERHLLSPIIAGSAVEILYHYLPAKTSTGRLPAYPAGTEKHIVLTQGKLVVVIGDFDANLLEGDALFFASDIDHSFDNRSNRPCAYYLIISRRN